ncbi:MAG: ComEC/Rec2 family competence protein, partial [Oscillospiraceae bacterium]
MPLAVVLVVLVVLFCKIKCKFHWNVALISATLLFAMLWLAIYSYFFTLPQKEFVGKTRDATVVVMETGKSYMQELVSAKLKVTKVNGEEIKPFFVWCNGFDYYEIGDIVNSKLLFEKIDNPVSLRNSNIDKIVMQVKQEGETVQMGTQGGFEMFFKKLQVKASSILQLNVSGENGKICTAIVTGDKSELSKDVKMQFRQAGLSHILVVSGLHLGIIAGFATLLLGKIFKNKKFSTFLSILFVLVFVCFTGFTPSTVRAGVVICFVLIGKACHFETDAVTSMALALILLLLSNPYACLDAGLLLSFSSTLGLVFLSYFKHEYIEQLKTNKWFCFAKPFLVPLFVMVATLPVMIYINGNVSIVGILANIIVVPLLTPVLIMGVITLITAVLTGMSDIAFMFGFFEKVFIDIIRFFVNLANKVPYGTISVGGIYAFCICACIYGLAFFLYKNKKYKAMAV